MKISAIKCTNCNSILFSRARHDFRWCECKRIAIDGGFDYCKVSGSMKDISWIEIEVDTTIDKLYKDWSKIKNRYGLYVPGTAKYKKLKILKEQDVNR